ncbi:hypothetical protein D3C76_1180930 [compost metagenome]
MPTHVFLHGRQLHRRRQDAQRQVACIEPRQAAVHGGDALGADDQLRQGVEVVGDDFHAAFAAVLAHEPLLYAGRAAAPEGDADMP